MLLCHVTGQDHWDLPKGGAHDGESALARDGISCTVCHRIAATDLGQEHRITSYNVCYTKLLRAFYSEW